MSRKLKVVFISLCSLAHSVKWHSQWIPSLDSNFPSCRLFTHPTVRDIDPVLIVPPIRCGIIRLLYRVFYKCSLAPSSGNMFIYLWLRCDTPTVDA